MSTSFEVFPTNQYIPACDEIVRNAADMFAQYLKRKNISLDLEIQTYETVNVNEVSESPEKLVLSEDRYNTFSLNRKGNVFVYWHKHSDLTLNFWAEEQGNNERARNLKKQIDANLKIGYSWSVVRTAGQPPLVGLFYGYLALAIAKLTDGIIFSDDGAWEYSQMPAMADEFEKLYLDVENIRSEI